MKECTHPTTGADIECCVNELTSPDLVQAGQHTDHERSWNCDGVLCLFKHYFISLCELQTENNKFQLKHS